MTSKSGFRGEFTVYFQHGMLIIEDPESRARHQEWGESASLVSIEPDSIYLGVIPSVDGPVKVSVYDEPAPSEEVRDLESRFSGNIHTKHGVLRVHDPEDSVSLIVQCSKSTVGIRIYANGGDWIERVLLELA